MRDASSTQQAPPVNVARLVSWPHGGKGSGGARGHEQFDAQRAQSTAACSLLKPGHPWRACFIICSFPNHSQYLAAMQTLWSRTWMARCSLRCAQGVAMRSRWVRGCGCEGQHTASTQSGWAASAQRGMICGAAVTHMNARFHAPAGQLWGAQPRGAHDHQPGRVGEPGWPLPLLVRSACGSWAGAGKGVGMEWEEMHAPCATFYHTDLPTHCMGRRMPCLGPPIRIPMPPNCSPGQ